MKGSCVEIVELLLREEFGYFEARIVPTCQIESVSPAKECTGGKMFWAFEGSDEGY